MRFKRVIELFDAGNCIVYGEKGSGKDVLTGNVMARRSQPYVSNLDYTLDDRFVKLDFDLLDCGKNSYVNFLDGHIKFYDYPYPDGSDIIISDVGVYLPCQYNGELNKRYPFLPTFFALQRHLSDGGSLHCTTQDLKRPWDKLREQSRRYILCMGVIKPLIKFGIVVQRIRTYSLYESAVKQISPCRVTVPFLAKREQILQAQMHRDNYFNTHGEVNEHLLIYLNKSKHDPFYFRKLLKGGFKNEKI